MPIDHDDVEIKFPITFAVPGTPVSLQASGQSREDWKQRVREASRTVVAEHCWASDEQVSLTIYDFPTDATGGDIDNIIKPIQDAMCPQIVQDDEQISRVVAQRFTPHELDKFEQYPDLVAEAMVNNTPFVFIRLSNDPLGEAQ